MGDSRNTYLAIAEESTYDTFPTSVAMQKIPYNPRDGVTDDRNNFQSAKVGNASKPRQTRLGIHQPSVTIATELQTEVHDLLYAIALNGKWQAGTAATVAGADLTVVGTPTNTIQFTDGTSWSADFDVVIDATTGYTGKYIYYNDNSNGYKILKISSLSTTSTSNDTAAVTLADGTTDATLDTSPATTQSMVVGYYGGDLIDSVSGDLVVTPNATNKTFILSGTDQKDWTANWGVKANDNIIFSGGGSFANDDSWFKVVSVSTTSVTNDTITVEETVTGTTASDATIYFMTDVGYLENSIYDRSYSLEEGYTDVEYRLTTTPSVITSTGIYVQASGMKVDTLTVDFPVEEIVSVSFENQGAHVYEDTGTPASTTYSVTYLDDPQNIPMASIDSVITGTFTDATGATQTFPFSANNVCIETLSFTVANNLSRQNCMGKDYTAAMNIGYLDISGNMTAYFNNQLLSSINFNELAVYLQQAVVDSTKAGYIFNLNNLLLLGATKSIGDIDVTQSIDFTGQPVASGSPEITIRRQFANRT